LDVCVYVHISAYNAYLRTSGTPKEAGKVDKYGNHVVKLFENVLFFPNIPKSAPVAEQSVGTTVAFPTIQAGKP
jgi:hypothetical protein